MLMQRAREYIVACDSPRHKGNNRWIARADGVTKLTNVMMQLGWQIAMDGWKHYCPECCKQYVNPTI